MVGMWPDFCRARTVYNAANDTNRQTIEVTPLGASGVTTAVSDLAPPFSPPLPLNLVRAIDTTDAGVYVLQEVVKQAYLGAALRFVPRDGSDPSTLADGVTSAVSDADFLYAADATNGVRRISKHDNTAVALAPLPRFLSTQLVAANACNLYVLGAGTDGSRFVFAVPKSPPK